MSKNDSQEPVTVTDKRRIDPTTWHRRSPLAKLLEVLFFQLRYLL